MKDPYSICNCFYITKLGDSNRKDFAVFDWHLGLVFFLSHFQSEQDFAVFESHLGLVFFISFAASVSTSLLESRKEKDTKPVKQLKDFLVRACKEKPETKSAV